MTINQASQRCRKTSEGEVNQTQEQNYDNGQGQSKILIIEDNTYVREAFELTLQRTSLDAHVVTTAEEAMQAVKKYSFDIIICDYRLPGMDGVEFFTLAQPYTPNAAKVLTSAYGFEDLENQAESIPVDHFVLKPFSIHRLLIELSPQSAMVSN